ncbi:MAG: TIGR04255 family protein [Methanobacteriaceae archaeon]
MHSTIIEVREDDYLLRFQFGLYNTEYPSPIARKEFVLDYDCYIEGEIDILELFKRSDECNKIIYSWFERSIQDELRKEMGML